MKVFLATMASAVVLTIGLSVGPTSQAKAETLSLDSVILTETGQAIIPAGHTEQQEENRQREQNLQNNGSIATKERGATFAQA
ncbi:MAG: hypothetical protein GDA50_07335 [Alphaproteobacteria bacterium GM202ARS2]|nr:hypothetical protein [Alphaproteobacteria bacterium GM202ARS2]